MNSIQALMNSTLGVLTVGAGIFGLAIPTQAQIEIIEEEVIVIGEIPSEQLEGLIAVAKMAEGQRTYYKKHGKFLNQVDEIQKFFDIVLPDGFNYAIRTTSEAAYNYVIPKNDSLQAFVGSTFLAPDDSGELTTIICLNEEGGQERLADPHFVRNPLNPTQIGLQCGEYSVLVPESELTE